MTTRGLIVIWAGVAGIAAAGMYIQDAHVQDTCMAWCMGAIAGAAIAGLRP